MIQAINITTNAKFLGDLDISGLQISWNLFI